MLISSDFIQIESILKDKKNPVDLIVIQQELTHWSKPPIKLLLYHKIMETHCDKYTPNTALSEQSREKRHTSEYFGEASQMYAMHVYMHMFSMFHLD